MTENVAISGADERTDKSGRNFSCITTGKQTYSSRSDARRQMVAINHKYRRGAPCMIYNCRHCGHWHIGRESKWKGDRTQSAPQRKSHEP